MVKVPLTTVGKTVDSIDVRLSYKIVDLFSEGLYASPNKAIEELVANAFDAGAANVHVLLSPNLHAQDASIVVIDDGEGMDPEGLKRHWLIGSSNKRRLDDLPKGRQQIGKFGIGKLATYVLSEQLSHLSKRNGHYFAASMDYRNIDREGDTEVQPTKPITIPLRELTEAEAKQAARLWTNSKAFKGTRPKLFGRGSAQSWTLTAMTSLKPKVLEIRAGYLEWVLRTALPLRPDFAIWLNGKQLSSSKQGRGLLKRWVLGRDLILLPKPAPKAITVVADDALPTTDALHFGFDVPLLGRVTGYAEAYKDLLTGKSDELSRSNGFFVYVFGRLVNVDDGHFGISPDELRHGTFGRFRAVVQMDGLDQALRSNREAISAGPLLETAKDVLRGIFNAVRPTIDKQVADEAPAALLARKVAATPASLSRTPIVDLARSVAAGRRRSRYLVLPEDTQRSEALARLEGRAQDGADFITGLTLDYSASPEDGLARYDIASGVLRINAWHPFVATFYDEFYSKATALPLQLLAMAEVLNEARLVSMNLDSEIVDEFLSTRDQLLRYLANESGRKSAFSVALGLVNARNNPDALEDALNEAFGSLGFDVTPIGGSGKPDGVATAPLSADSRGRARRYSVSLEAKSKEKDKGKVAAGTVKVSAIRRQRDAYQCNHTIVVGRDFPAKATSALAIEIDDDRKTSKAAGTPKTITLMTIDDLARLVRLRPLKQLGLAKLRDLFECRLPDEAKHWVDAVEGLQVAKPPHRQIVQCVYDLQKEFDSATVEYGALRVALTHLTPPIKYATNDELHDLCTAMMQMAPGAVYATARTVELDQSVENVVAALDTVMKDYQSNGETAR